MTQFNIYCDESCHLPHDRQPVMVLGALKMPAERAPEVADRIRAIKAEHGLPPAAELKWGKVSPRWLDVYAAMVDFFFDETDLAARTVVAQKVNLDHEAFNQTHDDWYYKTYYLLLRDFLKAEHEYRVYLDIKDTRGGPKVRHLHDVLCSGMYDFSGQTLTRLQTVRSHEVQHLQLVDILVGALGYANRQITDPSPAKLALVEQISRRSGRDLQRSTPRAESKFNVFHWAGSR